MARRPLCVGLLQKPNYTPSFMGDLDPARPGGARASCTIAQRRVSGQPRVGELEGASRGRRGKPRKAKARNPGRPSEKSENVLGARGKQARALAGAHPPVSPTLTHALTPTPHRSPTHAVLASTGSRASAPEPSRERSRPPTPPAPPLPGCQEPFRRATGAPRMTGGAGRAPRNGAQGGSYLRKGKGSREQEAAADKYSLGSVSVSF